MSINTEKAHLHRPRVYIASKLLHAPLWRDWRDADVHRINIVSTWHDNLTIATDDHDPLLCRSGWTKNLLDINRADALLAFGDAGEPLNGTLVEIGAALSRGINIYLVGSYPWGTWRHAHNVYQCKSLSDAIYSIREDLF